MAAVSDVEKVSPDTQHVDNVNGDGSMNLKMEEDEYVDPLIPAERKRLYWRIDLRVTCVLGILYVVGQIDKNNLGAANIAGMSTDLQLTGGSRYSIIVLVMFITYSTCQPIAVVLLRKLGSRSLFTSIVFLWGLTTIAFGFVKDWYDMIPLRIILGVFEAGMFPCAVYMMSSWYTRYKLQKRIALFYVIGTLASAFTGILAYVVSRMNGLGEGPDNWGRYIDPENLDAGREDGIAGWRWIFILFGIITLALATFCNPFVVDFLWEVSPGKFAVSFLSRREIDVVIADLQRDRDDTHAEEFSIKHYLAHAWDPKVWAHAISFGCTTTTNYAVSYFLPIILREGLGFSIVESQCLTAPPYLLACVWMMFFGCLSDKWQLRSPFLAFNSAANTLGLGLDGFTDIVGLRFFGLFLVTSAGSANLPSCLAWQQNNIRGQWKRTLCSALTIGTGVLGGFVGGTVFRTQDAPRYVLGCGVVLGANAVQLAITAALVSTYWRANKRIEAGGPPIEGLASFKYTL